MGHGEKGEGGMANRAQHELTVTPSMACPARVQKQANWPVSITLMLPTPIPLSLPRRGRVPLARIELKRLPRTLQ
eukprot:4545624-Alexandrium_andersonii.AAC.1